MDVKNYDELLNCIQCAVKDEIDYRKCYSREKKSKGILLTGGKRLEDVSEYFLYMFLLKDKLDISLDFSYLLVIGNNYYEGSISLLTDEKLVWASGIDLGESIENCIIMADEISLLDSIYDKLIALKQEKNFHNKSLVKKIFGLDEIRIRELRKNYSGKDDLNEDQIECINRAVGSDVLFIWGPPGTGKSKTLSRLVQRLYCDGKKILLVSHTHAAVDSLLEKALEYFTDAEKDNGVIMRYGSTGSEKLIKVTPDAIVEKKAMLIIGHINKLECELNELDSRLKALKSFYPLFREMESLKSKQIELEKNIDSLNIELDRLLKYVDDKQSLLDALRDELDRIKESTFLRNILFYKKSSLLKKIFSLIKQLAVFRKDEDVLRCKLQTYNDDKIKIDLQINKCIMILEKKCLNIMSSMGAHKEIIRLENRFGDLSKIEIDLRAKLESLKKDIWQRNRILGATMTAAVLKTDILRNHWDVIILDELSMAPSYLVLLACGLARHSVVLCGDFLQLSPIAGGDTPLIKAWLKRSVFDIRGITEKVSKGISDIPEMVMLRYQYRSHPLIAESISKIVYNGQLLNGLHENHDNFSSKNCRPAPGSPLVLIDTSGSGYLSTKPELGKGSLINLGSAEIVFQLINYSIDMGFADVGVITPFAAQSRLIKERIEDQYPSLRIPVSTVHRYQGSEKDIIIFDLVESGMNWVSKLTKGYHGTEAMRLINVAATRAKGKLIIVANVEFYRKRLGKLDVAYQWLDYIENNGCLLKFDEFLCS